MIHRYAMLGVLDEQGFPLREMGILQAPKRARRGRRHVAPMAGAPCPECGNATLIHKDGCDFCTACGYVGRVRLSHGDRLKTPLSAEGGGDRLGPVIQNFHLPAPKRSLKIQPDGRQSGDENRWTHPADPREWSLITQSSVLSCWPAAPPPTFLLNRAAGAHRRTASTA